MEKSDLCQKKPSDAVIVARTIASEDYTYWESTELNIVMNDK